MWIRTPSARIRERAASREINYPFGGVCMNKAATIGLSVLLAAGMSLAQSSSTPSSSDSNSSDQVQQQRYPAGQGASNTTQEPNHSIGSTSTDYTKSNPATTNPDADCEAGKPPAAQSRSSELN